MTAKATGTLIGVVLVVVGIALGSLSLENEDFKNADCGSALSPNNESNLVRRICEKQIRDRRIISGVVAGSGVLTIIIASGIFATQPVKPSPTPKKLIFDAELWHQVAKIPLRQEAHQKDQPKTVKDELPMLRDIWWNEFHSCSQCGESWIKYGPKSCPECGAAD